MKQLDSLRTKASRLFTVAMMLLATMQVSAQEKKLYVVVDSTAATAYFDNLYEEKNAAGAVIDTLGTPGYESITTFTFDASCSEARPTSTKKWFANCRSLKEINGMEKLNTCEVTDMSEMFYFCDSLTTLDVSHFNTDKVTDMSHMFHFCKGLTSLDVSNFNTANVTNMRGMFSTLCLTSLDVSNFNTSNVTDMGGMFYGCLLRNLDVSHFDTSKVTNMASMFAFCMYLASLDVSHFNTANVTDMGQMFWSCDKLASIDLSNFSTEKIENPFYMYNMFLMCSSLKSVTIGEKMTQVPRFPMCDQIKKIVSYIQEPTAIATDCFTDGVKTNAKLYVPNAAVALYQNTDGWKDFQHIAAKDLAPQNEETPGFGKDDIDENTDLNGNEVNNIFFNVPAEAGGYDATEGCLTLSQAMTDEQVEAIVGKDLFDDDLLNNFTGMIFMLEAGNGTITVDAATVGDMQLNVKIGDAKAVKQQPGDKRQVSVSYAATEPTYVYIYGTASAASEARGMYKANAKSAGAALKIYGVKWDVTTGIDRIQIDTDQKAEIYNLNGQRVNTPARGIYIINGKKVMVK